MRPTGWTLSYVLASYMTDNFKNTNVNQKPLTQYLCLGQTVAKGHIQIIIKSWHPEYFFLIIKTALESLQFCHEI